MARPDISILPTPVLLKVYNAAASSLGRPGVSEFLNRDLALARVTKILEIAPIGIVSSSSDLGVAVLPYRVRHLEGDDVIIRKMQGNPKLDTTEAALRWAWCLRDGMTIGEYVDACWAQFQHRRRRVLQDVRHNVKHNWISLQDFVREDLRRLP